MLKSKDISAYFKAKLSDLAPGVPLEFSVYLYFPGSDHILAWLAKGEELSEEFLAKYEAKGLKRIWIHKDEKDAFKNYRRTSAAARKKARVTERPPLETQAPADLRTEAEPLPSPGGPAAIVPGSEGSSLPSAPVATDASEPEPPGTVRTRGLAQAAQALIRESLSAPDSETQSAVHEKARKAVYEILADLGHEAHSLVSKTWKDSGADAGVDHAANVATYTVLLALAFGSIDPALISDLALAGLLHDVGITQIPLELAQAPWDLMDDARSKAYGAHVASGLELIEEFAPEIPERVRMIIAQHHEKFDGTGYPEGRSGFDVEGVPQLLAIVELLDSVASGQYDGQQRTYGESLDVIEGLEKKQESPTYFTPEVFDAVLNWVRGEASETDSQRALEAVHHESAQLLKKAS